MSRPSQNHETHWQSAKQRFHSFVMADPNSGCWLWTGTCKTDKYGNDTYGCISVGSRMYLAHRFSYEIHIGPITCGLFVLHKCDVRACVNPDHLWLGTQSQNMQDAWQKGRGVHPDCNGEKAAWAKLTEDDVKAIRSATPEWGGFKKLADKFGISPQALCDIRKRRTWKLVG